MVRGERSSIGRYYNRVLGRATSKWRIRAARVSPIYAPWKRARVPRAIFSRNVVGVLLTTDCMRLSCERSQYTGNVYGDGTSMLESSEMPRQKVRGLISSARRFTER